MKRYVIRAFSVFLIGVVFSGCVFDSTPKCSDDNVQSLVKEIYQNMLEQSKDNILLAVYMSNAPKSIVSLSSIRAVSYDKDVNLRECKSIAHFDNGLDINLDYSVQMAENGDEFYVEFKEDFIQNVMMNSMMSIMNNKN